MRQAAAEKCQRFVVMERLGSNAQMMRLAVAMAQGITYLGRALLRRISIAVDQP